MAEKKTFSLKPAESESAKAPMAQHITPRCDYCPQIQTLVSYWTKSAQAQVEAALQ